MNEIRIDPLAKEDIQKSIDWYNSQQRGLGKKFFDELNFYINKLKESSFYRIRYDEVKCVPLKRFPFMIHYTENKTNKTIVIRAIFHTSLDSELWKNR